MDEAASVAGHLIISVKGVEFPKGTILVAVFVYVCDPVSCRHLGEIVARRGARVEQMTLNRRVAKFSPMIATKAQRRKTTAPSDAATCT